MRILMLTSDVSLQCGIARHVLAISSALSKNSDIKIAICTVYPHGELSDALEKVGVRSYELNAVTGHAPRSAWRFRNIVHDFKPDVIHIHMLAMMERMYLSWFNRRIPLVLTTHGISDIGSGIRKATLKDRVESVLTSLMPISVAKNIYISEGVRRFNQEEFGDVVYNPMCFDDRVSCANGDIRAELGLDHQAQLIGTACRISPPKNPMSFVDVMCRVLKAQPKVHAVICGTSEDDNLMRNLKTTVARYDVGARFHWLGYRRDAAAITQQLNCFVMTSVTEGMPTALLEAMSVRTPIAFMRGYGGLVDLDLLDKQEGPIGVVVNAGDNAGMCDGICALLSHPEKAQEMASRAFDVGKKHFSVEIVSKQLDNIYHEVMKND